MSCYSLLFVPLCAFAGAAFSATFGTAVPITGGATDLVLDEARGQLYIVNSTQNRIEVYSTRQRQLLGTMPTDQQPLAAAISRDGKYLYVTSYATSVLDVIDLDAQAVVSRI
ncbi:MAG: beta-propeller fold lactonase family protein, partial [Acidobacteria bacterium]|nr:beta-propeller fold lactonase family protein [Acidobacteriota bacterium]